MNIFFTSDLHFGHDKDFLWGNRGFSSSKEHDEAIIKLWNETVAPDDIVYVLGDLIMGDDQQYGFEHISRLNGRIAFIFGNHDTANKVNGYLNCENVDQSPMNGNQYANIIRSGKWSFYCSHRPTLIDDISHKRNKLFGLHGHTHSKDKFEFIEHCSYNVALDAHDNRPVNIEQIKADIRAKMEELKAQTTE